MTLDDVSASTMNGEIHVIAVRKHKTAVAYGSYMFNMSDSLYTLLLLYIKHIRPIVANNSTPTKVFIGKNGLGHHTSDINTCLKSFATKTKALPENVLRKFCSTSIRKTTVTNTRDREEADKSNIATLMAHSLNTANKHYQVRDKIQATGKAHETMKSLYGSPVKKPKRSSSSDAAKEEDHIDVRTPIKEPEPEQQTPNRRIPWAAQIVAQIEKASEPVLSGEISCARAVLVDFVNGSTILAQLAKAHGLDRLVEKIKTLRKKRKQDSWK